MNRLSCQSCSEQKNNLNRHKSSVIENYTMWLCQKCIDNGYEPRHIIIIALHQLGLTPEINDILRNNKYYGQKINSDR